MISARWTRILLVTVLLAISIQISSSVLLGAEPSKEEKSAPAIAIPENLERAVMDEASSVKEKIATRARGLFQREPLNFDLATFKRIRDWFLDLPALVPGLLDEIVEESQLLGLVGSLIVLVFLGALLYSLFGARKVLKRLQAFAEPLKERIPDIYYPYFMSLLKIFAASIIPLLFFGLFSFVHELIDYDASWFLLVGSLLKLWAFGAVVLSLLQEALLPAHLSIPVDHAHSIYRVSRIVVIYALAGIGLLWGAEAFEVPSEILGLIKFVVSLSIVFASLFLLLKKKSIIAILPQLPYKSYQILYLALQRLYYPAIIMTFITGVLWCFGYKDLTQFVWVKIWAVIFTFFLVIVVYHNLKGLLLRWMEKKDVRDDLAKALYLSLKTFLLFCTVTITIIVVLDLLGLLDIIQEIISFPLLIIGETAVSLWILGKATLIILAFIFSSRLLRAYLDYKVYPSLGLEEGLAYSINTLVGYILIVTGVLASLRAVGLDLRILMLFAGAVGIGVGLGLQSLAGNLISGFILIFGRKVRKGDWIQVGERLGYVQEVSLRATRVRTRDNIEYLIPNSELTTSTIVNYTLSEPEIRVHIPVGVSYSASPEKVVQILLSVAERNPNVNKHLRPKVWFVEYGDSSINFELLAWIDVRQISEREVRSELYFEIFDALAEAGIEIPFPQRDLHIRSGLANPSESSAE